MTTTLDDRVPCFLPIIDNRNGRIGPSNVKFDVSAHFGLFIIGSERLSVHSQSNFSSILCNVCVYQGWHDFAFFIYLIKVLTYFKILKLQFIILYLIALLGKWQFEVQLGTKGVMQIGWATRGCRFSQETGVGDTFDSYAYDGNRIRKWNSYTQKYGQPWLSGDIIGCCGDFDKGSLEFFR